MTICDNELPIKWYDQNLTKAGTYFHTEQYADTLVDSVIHILHLNVLPVLYTYHDTTMYEGEKHTWRGKTYTKAGVYRDTLQSSFGCDSILVFTLTVLQNHVTVNNIDVSQPCADNAQVDITLGITGLVDFLKFTFSSEAKAMGMSDVTMPMPSNARVRFNYGTVRAGKYKATITGIFRNMEVFAEEITLSFRYQSSVLEQRWNDVIAVLAHDYNGGYDFIAFQWYKDGQPIEGENNYYLTRPLEEGAEYSVLLTESDSTQLMSCPLMIGIKEDSEVTVEPTLITNKQLVRCVVPDAATIYVYDMTGQIVRNDMLLQGETYIQMPYLPGIYMVKVLLKTGDMSDFKIVVL